MNGLGRSTLHLLVWTRQPKTLRSGGPSRGTVAGTQRPALWVSRFPVASALVSDALPSVPASHGSQKRCWSGIWTWGSRKVPWPQGFLHTTAEQHPPPIPTTSSFWKSQVLNAFLTKTAFAWGTHSISEYISPDDDWKHKQSQAFRDRAHDMDRQLSSPKLAQGLLIEGRGAQPQGRSPAPFWETRLPATLSFGSLAQIF